MHIDTHNITQADPVLFRVTSLGPSPVAELSRPGWLVLHVAFLNKDDGLPGMNMHIPPEWYQPHLEAISEAIESQAVYWVDWDYSKTPTWPIRSNDSTVERLLRAIGERQVVKEEPGD